MPHPSPKISMPEQTCQLDDSKTKEQQLSPFDTRPPCLPPSCSCVSLPIPRVFVAPCSQDEYEGVLTTEEEEDDDERANEDAAPGRLLEEGGGSDSQEDDDDGDDDTEGGESDERSEDEEEDGDDSYDDGEGDRVVVLCPCRILLPFVGVSVWFFRVR